jgi:phage gp45-like
MNDPDLDRHVGKYYGKYSGEVADNKDAAKLGRITVKVPSVLGELEVIARPCLPYGHFFVPAKGSMVWVEFEGGDPAYPIWVGTWYPDGKVPVEAALDPPDNRVIQTASGHTIEILDKDGEEKIVIKHKANAFISIDKQGSVLLSNKEGSHLYLNAEDGEATLVEQHGHMISMTEKGVIVANKDGKMVQVSGDTAAVVADNIVLHGATVALGGGTAAEMQPAVLGNDMMTLFTAHTHPTAVGPSGPPIPVPMPMAPGPAGMGLSSTVLVKK